MTDANGQLPGQDELPGMPQPLLAGHLVVYQDAVAFRPDGGGDDQVVRHNIGEVIRETLVHMLTSQDLGRAAGFLRMDASPMMAMMSGMNRHDRRAMKAATKGQADG